VGDELNEVQYFATLNSQHKDAGGIEDERLRE
jgi:hypothetical protein